MASPFNRGALTRMKERRAYVPLMDTEMAGPHKTPIAATQVERQVLSPRAEQSTVTKDDPEVVAKALAFSEAPIRPTPHHTEGKQVFTDQKQVEELHAEADIPPLTSFKSEFKAARARGDKEFAYKGDRFNTREKGETAAGWLEAIRTPFEPGFTRERAVTEIPSRRPNEAALGFLMGDTDFEDIKFTPTPGQKSIMEAPVETKATTPASPAIVTDELNAKREAEGLTALRMTSGYRSAQQNATAMMNNVEAAGSIEQARANGYTGKHYQPALKAYYADPTRANLEAIGYIRLEREKVISGGHAGGDSADYSVSDLTNKADALKRVAWLKKQGYRVQLENWSGAKKGKNAHIHIDGIKH